MVKYIYIKYILQQYSMTDMCTIVHNTFDKYIMMDDVFQSHLRCFSVAGTVCTRVDEMDSDHFYP